MTARKHPLPVPGQVFHAWTVIADEGASGGKPRYVLVRCECGTEGRRAWQTVVSGTSRGCLRCFHARRGTGRIVARSVNEGERFSRWTVLRGGVRMPGKRVWSLRALVRCDCGALGTVSEKDLIWERARSCDACAEQRRADREGAAVW